MERLWWLGREAVHGAGTGLGQSGEGERQWEEGRRGEKRGEETGRQTCRISRTGEIKDWGTKERRRRGAIEASGWCGGCVAERDDQHLSFPSFQLSSISESKSDESNISRQISPT